jgi:hypothetical protein
MKISVDMLTARHFSHPTRTGVPVRERQALLADKGIFWDELNQAVRRLLTERTVTHFRTMKQSFESLDVEPRDSGCGLTTAPATRLNGPLQAGQCCPA